MNDPLTHHAELARASLNLLEAAKQGDWNRIRAEESVCAQLIDQLQTHNAPPPTDPGQRQQQLDWMQQALDHQQQVRQLLAPHLEQLSSQLRGARNSERLGRTYTAY